VPDTALRLIIDHSLHIVLFKIIIVVQEFFIFLNGNLEKNGAGHHPDAFISALSSTIPFNQDACRFPLLSLPFRTHARFFLLSPPLRAHARFPLLSLPLRLGGYVALYLGGIVVTFLSQGESKRQAKL
jgi:hypothetical protein